MTKDVIISIQGLQYAVENEEDSPIEVISFGEYHKRGDKHYLIYEEPQEGSTQMIKSRIKFSEKGLELVKKGESSTHMIFIPGEEYMCCYETPYGDLTLGLKTHSLKLQEEDDFIRMDLVYELAINAAHLAKCTLVVRVQPRGIGRE